MGKKEIVNKQKNFNKKTQKKSLLEKNQEDAKTEIFDILNLDCTIENELWGDELSLNRNKENLTEVFERLKTKLPLNSEIELLGKKNDKKDKNNNEISTKKNKIVDSYSNEIFSEIYGGINHNFNQPLQLLTTFCGIYTDEVGKIGEDISIILKNLTKIIKDDLKKIIKDDLKKIIKLDLKKIIKLDLDNIHTQDIELLKPLVLNKVINKFSYKIGEEITRLLYFNEHLKELKENKQNDIDFIEDLSLMINSIEVIGNIFINFSFMKKYETETYLEGKSKILHIKGLSI